MKWRGETNHSRTCRLQQWHKFTPLIPRQAYDGTWVWLEPCWRKLCVSHWAEQTWVYSADKDMPTQDWW